MDEQVRGGGSSGPSGRTGGVATRGGASSRLASPIVQASPDLSRGSSLLFPSPANSSILVDGSLEEVDVEDEGDGDECWGGWRPGRP